MFALELIDDSLYAGGNFSAAGGVVNAARVAVWSASDDTWRALGTGVDSFVNALTVSDDTLFAGGSFTSAGGVSLTSRIAGFEGAGGGWRSLAGGLSSDVEALAATDDTVYAGGYFTLAGGLPNASRLAAWSRRDNAWRAVGAGVNSYVFALEASDDTLYVGGAFTSAIGVASTSRIAAWSHADDTWHALGSGVNDTVLSLTSSDDSIYVGGTFTDASGVPGTRNIATWSVADDTWQALGAGLDDYVQAVAVDDTRGLLYVAGSFTSAVGGASNSLLQAGVWDAGIAEWIPLDYGPGNGINDFGRALAVDDSIVYLGGQFSDAGGIAAADGVARWTWDPPQGANTLTAGAGSTVTVTGEGFIGVPATGGVTIGGTPVTYTRDDSSTLTVTVPGGRFSNVPILVQGVGGWGNVGTFTTSAPVVDGVLGWFSPLGAGISSGGFGVYSMALRDDTLTVGGAFDNAGGVAAADRIASWSTTAGTWSAVGSGLSGIVQSLAWRADDTVYAGGSFASAGGVSGTAKVAAWSHVDDTWHALGTGVTGGDVYTLATSADDTVYAGGNFTSASGVASTGRVAAWSTADDTWRPLGPGINQASTYVSSLAVQGDDTVFVSGDFTAIGTQAFFRSAAWSNADDTWRSLGSGVGQPVYATTLQRDDTLYVTGPFTDAGGGTPNSLRIAAWSAVGQSWSALGLGLDSQGYALAVDDTRGLVYAGGQFTAEAGSAANSLRAVGVWDIGVQEWIPLSYTGGNGVNSIVRSLALDDSIVYVGGDFTNAGDVAAADKIATWTWDPPQGANTVTAGAGSIVTVTGEGFIGVARTGGVKVGGTVVSYTRDDSSTITLTVPAGNLVSAPVTVLGVGGWGQVGTVSSPAPAPAPAPALPPGAPTGVSAQAGDRSVLVSWRAPTLTGSFPVTNYEVADTSGMYTCLHVVSAGLPLACDVRGLTNGAAYSFRVRALSGAGWGEWSQFSGAVTPRAPTIMITGSRDRPGSRRVSIEGTTTRLEGEAVRPWLRLQGQSAFVAGKASTAVASDGSFAWGRRTSKALSVYFTHEVYRSNTVSLPARRL